MDDILRKKGPHGRVLSNSAITKIASNGPVDVFHEDKSEGKSIIETIQDVEPILKANVEEYKSGDGYSRSRELKKVASIPLVEVHRLMQRGINIFDRNDWPKIAAKLDDPDWLKYRTSPGKISRRPNREYFRASTRR